MSIQLLVWGAALGLLFIVTLRYHKRLSSQKLSTFKHKIASPNHNRNQTISSAPSENNSLEKIRQIGLIQRDEFARFYEPIINVVKQYEHVLGVSERAPEYFETIYKTLRKRRAAIFEYTCSERDHDKRAVWSYALFCSVSLRHVVNQLAQFTFSNNEKETVAPVFYTPDELASLEIRPATTSQHKATIAEYPCDHLNLHLIDKVIPNTMIVRLQRESIYPFVINAVTGLYSERINPFYNIIEQVEAHMAGARETSSERDMYRQTMDHIVKLIQNNTFHKNTSRALIFEGESFLLIDGYLLWALFKSFFVSANPFCNKLAFEAKLFTHLIDDSQVDAEKKYTIDLSDDHQSADSTLTNIRVFGAIAIPYAAIPDYKTSDQLNISQVNQTHSENIQNIDSNANVSNTPASEARESETQITKSTSTLDRKSSSSRLSPGVQIGDLFSDAQ